METLGHPFAREPERLASAWRRVRVAQMGGDEAPDNLLEGVIEDFIRQMGLGLSGMEGSPWGRTVGILRVSARLGPGQICDEFGALSRCLLDALGAMAAPSKESSKVIGYIVEAAECVLTLHRRWFDRVGPEPAIPFLGLVVERMEPQPPAALAPAGPPVEAVA
jgi:hypothetical protein